MSSKTCSSCGDKKSSLSLSQRVFHCHNCGFESDRDLNAAIKCDSRSGQVDRVSLWTG
ncbi:zinc ribbon domain-containing protein [Anabaena catenula]|uniref:zinc ribbon domain-containing protein n=1 Tax=Anabaena catenula TaxID=1296320 RepID=UPI003BB4BBB5